MFLLFFSQAEYKETAQKKDKKANDTA